MAYLFRFSFILAVAGFLGCKTPDRIDGESTPEGLTGISPASWDTPFVAFPKGTMTAEALEKYIDILLRSKNLNYGAEYSKGLAPKVIEVAKAVGLDPLIFAGLVAHESRFDHKAVNKNSKGVIGGTGLTQMTGLALTEVNDQWTGKTDKHGWNEHSSLVHARLLKILDAPPFQGKILKPVKSVNEFNGNSLAALFYGAVTLKMYLSRAIDSPSYLKECSLKKDQKIKDRKLKIYRAALTCYNAHEVNKLTYADKVFQDINNIIAAKSVKSVAPVPDSAKDSKKLSLNSTVPDFVDEDGSDEAVAESATFAKDDDECWTIQVFALGNDPDFEKIGNLLGKATKVSPLYVSQGRINDMWGDGFLISMGKFNTLRDAQEAYTKMVANDPENKSLQNAWIRMHDVEYVRKDDRDVALPSFCSSQPVPTHSSQR
jgi:hypothetical protein